MAKFSSFRYLLVFLFINLYLKFMFTEASLEFDFYNFGKDSNFKSQLALFGETKVGNDNMSVEINGRVISKKPINLIEGSLKKNMVSFSSYFVFSISRGIGDGLGFVMLPMGFPLNEFVDGGSMGMLGKRKMKFLGVEFDTFKDDKYGDVNGNHVGVDVESFVSVKVSNVSSINLVLDSGEKLQAWIDYEASSKRFEVRLSKLGDIRPVAPLLSYSIDLSKMWRRENVTVGFSSLSANLYSWSFRSRIVPQWMHSEPMDPEHKIDKKEERNIKVTKRSDCALKILVALVLGAGCGALGAMFVLYVWTILGNRRPIVPEELKEIEEYKKFNVVIDKTIKDGEKK